MEARLDEVEQTLPLTLPLPLPLPLARLDEVERIEAPLAVLQRTRGHLYHVVA